MSLRIVFRVTTGAANIAFVEFLEPLHPVGAELLVWIESQHCISSVRIAGFTTADPGPKTVKESLSTCRGLRDMAEVFEVFIPNALEQSKKAAQFGQAVVSLSKPEPKLKGGDIRVTPGSSISRGKLGWEEKLERVFSNSVVVHLVKDRAEPGHEDTLELTKLRNFPSDHTTEFEDFGVMVSGGYLFLGFCRERVTK